MKRLALICIGTLSAAGIAAPALAQHVTPANTQFQGIGAAKLTKGPTVLNCTLTLNARTGADLGGAHANHAAGGTISGGTNAGPGNCPLLTVDASTFSITSSTATGGGGNINGLVVRLSGTPICSTTASLPFTVVNNGASASTIKFNSAIAPDCHVVADLNTTPDINVVP